MESKIAAEAVLQPSVPIPEFNQEVKGYDWSKGLDLNELLGSYSTTGFQATNFGLAVDEINAMISARKESIRDEATGEAKRGCTIFLGYTSNLVSSGLRETIRFLVQHNLVDCIVTTAGGVEEDFIKCLGSTLLGDFSLKGSSLREKGINRIGNLLVPNDNYCKFEDWVTPILNEMVDIQTATGEVWTPSKMIAKLGEKINNEESIYYWAWKNNIPVFSPALTDGSLGDMMFFHSYKKPGLILDILSDLKAINTTAMKAHSTGVIILGGGLIKHHICNANLMRNGTEHAVFVNTGQEFDGSDSGARPDEAVSWGKIKKDVKPVKLYADATLVFPLIVAQTFAKCSHTRVKRFTSSLIYICPPKNVFVCRPSHRFDEILAFEQASTVERALDTPAVRRVIVMNKGEREKYIESFEYPFCDDVGKYERLAKIGQGTFGEVFKARHKKSKRMVALKKVLMDNEKEGFPITALREIKILQLLKHENVVNLIEICRTKASGTNRYRSTFFLVFDFCDHDLAGLLSNVNVKFNLGEIKKVIQQLLNGLYYIHTNKILHRDMKAANVLLTKAGVLKLADFGLARAFSISKNQPNRYTNRVVTLWYRPPELLLGERNYGPAVDMWGAGCIMAEMWTRSPIMQGSTEQQQITLISQLCGSITPEVWPGVESLELYNRLELLKGQKRKVKDRLKFYVKDAFACDLLDKLLTLDPAKRVDADTALNHDFFWTDPMPIDLGEMLKHHSQSMFEYLAPPRRPGAARAQHPPANMARPSESGYHDRVF